MAQAYNSIYRKLPTSLKADNFWPQFVESISEELDKYNTLNSLSKLQKNVFEMKQTVVESNDPLLDTSNLFKFNLNQIASKYGYIIDTSLDDSFEFMCLDMLSLPHKIKLRGTYSGYTLPIRLIEEKPEVYTFIYNSEKMIKVIDWDAIIIKYGELDSDITNYTLPFTFVTSVFNFATLTSQIKFLDQQETLDSITPWNLDGRLTQFPTKHLGVELYAPDKYIKNNISYLIDETYFKYLEKATNFNKLNSSVVHTGISLNMMIPLDHSYDHFDTNEDYTIPSLNLKAHTTYTQNSLSNFDDVEYISIGVGNSSIPNSTNKNTFIYSDLLAYYSLQDPTIIIKDFSSAGFDLEVNGTITKNIEGVLGAEVFFDGNTYVSSSASRNISLPSVYSIAGWFKKNGESVNEQGILDIGKIKITLEDNVLHVYYARTLILDSTITSPNDPNHFLIEVDTTTDDASLFVNGIEVDHYSNISSLSFSTSVKNVIGVSLKDSDLSVDTNYFIGGISNIGIFNKKFSATERTYLVDDRYLPNYFIFNPICRIAISDIEKYKDTTWAGINTYLPALLVNDEVIHLKNSSSFDSTEVAEGTLHYPNIKPHSLKISYNKNVNGSIIPQTVQDDGKGLILGDYNTGTINYETGEYTLKFFNIHNKIYASNIVTPTSTISILSLSDIGHSGVDIIPGTLKITYKINGSYFSAVDVNGFIIGDNITNSSINYDEGIITLNTVGSLLFSESITISFDYYQYSIINSGTQIVASYNIYQDLENNTIRITEMALEDQNKNALVYVTFPAIEFHSINNYLATNIMMKLP